MRKRHRAAGAFAGVLGALVVGILPAAGDHDLYRRISSGIINDNGAYTAEFAGVSTDGTCAFFFTNERLVPGDTDGSADVYRRCGSSIGQMSVGAINGNGAHDANFLGSSADGSRVLFETTERLVSADTDARIDIYQRFGGVTTRVSAGNGTFDTWFAGQPPYHTGFASDAAHVFYYTEERIVAADTNSTYDLYEHFGTTTRLVSVGLSGTFGAWFRGASTDGSRVFFITNERLVPDDTDNDIDIYRRTAGVTTRVSVGVINGNGNGFDTDMAGMAGDGTHVFMRTGERLVVGDTDSVADIYVRTAGTTGRVSVGTINGNGPHNSKFEGSSADGSCAVFSTEERLLPNDTDAAQDIYRRCQSVTTRVSRGDQNGNGAYTAEFNHVSADGNCVTFTTAERLLTNDTDAQPDVYRRCGSTTARISRGLINGNGGYAAVFRFASRDGKRVFFETSEKLAPDDMDSATDVYERSFGTTTQISAGAINGNGAIPSLFAGASPNGRSVFFESLERLLAGDTDSSQDVYGVYVTP